MNSEEKKNTHPTSLIPSGFEYNILYVMLCYIHEHIYNNAHIIIILLRQPLLCCLHAWIHDHYEMNSTNINKNWYFQDLMKFTTKVCIENVIISNRHCRNKCIDTNENPLILFFFLLIIKIQKNLRGFSLLCHYLVFIFTFSSYILIASLYEMI